MLPVTNRPSAAFDFTASLQLGLCAKIIESPPLVTLQVPSNKSPTLNKATHSLSSPASVTAAAPLLCLQPLQDGLQAMARRQSSASQNQQQQQQQPSIISKTPNQSEGDQEEANGSAESSSDPRSIKAEETELLLIDQASTPAAERSLS